MHQKKKQLAIQVLLPSLGALLFAGLFLLANLQEKLRLRALPQAESIADRASGLSLISADVLAKQRKSFSEQFAAENAEEASPSTHSELTLLRKYERAELLELSQKRPEWSQALPVVVLRGDFHTMGQQYGALLAHRLQSLLEMFDALAQQESTGLLPTFAARTLRRKVGALFSPHFPQSTHDFISGIVAGAQTEGVAIEPGDLEFLSSLIDVAGIASTNLSFSLDTLGAAEGLIGIAKKQLGLEWLNQNCNTFVAFGPRTEGGKTFQTRNTDVTTGMGLEDFPLVTVFFPERASGDRLIPFVSAGFVGQLGVATGMNAHGVALGQVWAFSNKKSLGTPWSLAMIDILSQSKSAIQAAEMLTSVEQHTYGNNFVFGDASGNAIAVELNAAQHDTFLPNDPRELEEGRMPDGRVYALPLPHAIVRADLALSQKLRRDQTAAAGPHGFPPTTGSYRKRYAGQVKRLLAYERQKQLIGAREAMVISRATASRNHGNLQNAVYANSDKRLWVAYASGKGEELRGAFQNPFVLIPFDRLLQKERKNDSSGSHWP